MDLLDFTTPDGFLPRLDCNSLGEAVEQLVERLAAGGDVSSPDLLAQEVMRREIEGSTAIGGGLVIPHARFSGVRAVCLGVATLVEPLDLSAEDGRPVDIVILLVGPQKDPRQMLRVLARLARLVRQDAFLQSLRKAESADELQAAFAEVGASFG